MSVSVSAKINGSSYLCTEHLDPEIATDWAASAFKAVYSMEGYWEAANGHAPHPVKYESA